MLEFCIHSLGPLLSLATSQYCLRASGPSINLSRLLRAMQLSRPLMLEGDPGVGKTSLVSALAASSGHPLTRINLSEHTVRVSTTSKSLPSNAFPIAQDISDLFGADLPMEGEGKMQFAWRDGPFLKALRTGDWILLDEVRRVYLSCRPFLHLLCVVR